MLYAHLHTNLFVHFLRTNYVFSLFQGLGETQAKAQEDVMLFALQ